MACDHRLTLVDTDPAVDPSSSATLGITMRLADPEAESLWALLLRRYPYAEWGTFVQCGWRDIGDGLVLTLAALDSPHEGDLDLDVDLVRFREPYIRRVALAAEAHSFCVGVVHSHPADCRVLPSEVDDDMDTYFADYFSGFAPARPYVSLIVAEQEGYLVASGRVFWRGEWRAVSRLIADGRIVETADRLGRRPKLRIRHAVRERVERLASAFGDEAAARLRASTVAVLGAGGTGSLVIETLARAGVGHIITADPDCFTTSNHERVHGSRADDMEREMPKVDIARRHVHEIDPTIHVTALMGALPQAEVVDAFVHADLVLGCTDKHHSRAALSDLSIRYLVRALDVGVALEGGAGRVTGQTMQIVVWRPKSACAYCRRMIDPVRMAQELMPSEERAQRQRAAAAALARGDNADAYWLGEPQLNTVGYLTTMAGAAAAGYAIGWLTGRFEPPFARLQCNLMQPLWDMTDQLDAPREFCVCRRARGSADQGAVDAFLTAPEHWAPVQKRV